MANEHLSQEGPIAVVCIFRVVDGCEKDFEALLAKHWPALSAAGLVTDEPAMQWRVSERNGAPVYVEVFSWATADDSRRAHMDPSVMAIWGPMGELVEERGGKPSMEFLHGAALGSVRSGGGG